MRKITTKENLEGPAVAFDMKAFKKGVSSMSEIAGMIYALTTVGVGPNEALAFFSNADDNETVSASNIQIAKIDSETKLKCAELGAVQVGF